MVVGLNLGQVRAERLYVNSEVVTPSQVNRFPVGHNPGAAQGAVEGGEGAAQSGSGPRLVVFGPEQGRQRVAGLALAGDGQVGNEGHRLMNAAAPIMNLLVIRFGSQQRRTAS